MKSGFAKSAAVFTAAGFMIFAAAVSVFAAETGRKPLSTLDADFQDDSADFYQRESTGQSRRVPYWNKDMCQQEVDPESIEPGRYYIDKIYPTTGCRGILYKLFGIGGDEYKLIKVEEVIDKNIVIGTVKGVAFKDSETGKWTEIPIEWGNHHLFAVPDEPDETCCCANGRDR